MSSAATTPPDRAGADQRPNVVLITSHDLGRYLHCYGVPTVSSPHLDRLATEGVRFDAAFTTAPQCSPSRAALATGRYPHANGVMGLTHSWFGWDLYADERHIADILRSERGYRTGLVGVHHESYQGEPAVIAERCGFDSFEPGGLAETVSARAQARLREYAASADPFFLQVGFLEVHRLPSSADEPPTPMGFLGDHIDSDDSAGVTIPAYLRDTEGTRREIAELQGAVRHLDAAVGEVLHQLDRLGLSDDTLVIFTADHGLALPRAKCSLYDPGLETALLMRLPRRGWSGGRVVSSLVSNIDVFPTVLDATGLGEHLAQHTYAGHGLSLAELLDGDTEDLAREAIFGEITHHDYYDPRRCVRTNEYKLIVNFSSAPAFMNPSQSWRPRTDVAVPANPPTAYHPPLELYDLRTDPHETTNRADDPAYAGMRRYLLTRLHSWMSETADPLLEGAVAAPLHHSAVALLRGFATPGPAAPFG